MVSFNKQYAPAVKEGMMDYPKLAKSKHIIGMPVKDRNGKSVGLVSELVADISSGSINYAVVDFSNFKNPTNQYFAFPWPAFTYSSETECFLLDCHIELLKNTVGFAQTQWPNFVSAAMGRYYS